MHFVNYDPSITASFYGMSYYFNTNDEEANEHFNSIIEYDAINIKGMAEYFKASSAAPYYLTGVRGEFGCEDDIEADDVVISIVDDETGEVVATAPITSMQRDNWGDYFFTAPISPVLMEKDFFVIITPADDKVQISPSVVTTTSKENAYDDGTAYLLMDITYNGTVYNNILYDVYGLSFGDFNYLQASMIGIMTTYEEPDPSGINTVSAAKKADNSIYSISGVKVSNGSKKGLATGVYVQNGKKIVIK